MNAVVDLVFVPVVVAFSRSTRADDMITGYMMDMMFSAVLYT